MKNLFFLMVCILVFASCSKDQDLQKTVTVALQSTNGEKSSVILSQDAAVALDKYVVELNRINNKLFTAIRSGNLGKVDRSFGGDLQANFFNPIGMSSQEVSAFNALANQLLMQMPNGTTMEAFGKIIENRFVYLADTKCINTDYLGFEFASKIPCWMRAARAVAALGLSPLTGGISAAFALYDIVELSQVLIENGESGNC